MPAPLTVIAPNTALAPSTVAAPIYDSVTPGGLADWPFFYAPALTDLGTGTWTVDGETFRGGLYRDGSNEIPWFYRPTVDAKVAAITPLDASGSEDLTNGKIGLLHIGMSNCYQETRAALDLSAGDPEINPKVLWVNGAVPGKTVPNWANDGDDCWTTCATRMSDAGLDADQVQVLFYKNIYAHSSSHGQLSIDSMQTWVQDCVTNAIGRFPNIRLVYLTSRTYAGYGGSGLSGAPPGKGGTNLSPEPMAWQGSIAMRQVIDARMAGAFQPNGPALVWGPYLWAPGALGRADEVRYHPLQFDVRDMVHPTDPIGAPATAAIVAKWGWGADRVGQRMVDFYKSDPTATPWFLA